MSAERVEPFLSTIVKVLGSESDTEDAAVAAGHLYSLTTGCTGDFNAGCAGGC